MQASPSALDSCYDDPDDELISALPATTSFLSIDDTFEFLTGQTDNSNQQEIRTSSSAIPLKVIISPQHSPHRTSSNAAVTYAYDERYESLPPAMRRSSTGAHSPPRRPNNAAAGSVSYSEGPPQAAASQYSHHGQEDRSPGHMSLSATGLHALPALQFSNSPHAPNTYPAPFSSGPGSTHTASTTPYAHATMPSVQASSMQAWPGSAFAAPGGSSYHIHHVSDSFSRSPLTPDAGLQGTEVPPAAGAGWEPGSNQVAGELDKAAALQHQIVSLHHQNSGLQQRVQELQDSVTDAQRGQLLAEGREKDVLGKLAEAMGQLHAQDATLDCARHHADRLAAELRAAQEDLLQERARAAGLRNDLSMAQDTAVHLQRELEVLNRKMGHTSEEERRLDSEVATLQRENQYLSDLLTKARVDGNELREKLRLGAADAQKQASDAHAVVAHAATDRESLASQLAAARMRCSELEGRNSTMSYELTAARDECRRLRLDYEAMRISQASRPAGMPTDLDRGPASLQAMYSAATSSSLAQPPALSKEQASSWMTTSLTAPNNSIPSATTAASRVQRQLQFPLTGTTAADGLSTSTRPDIRYSSLDPETFRSYVRAEAAAQAAAASTAARSADPYDRKALSYPSSTATTGQFSAAARHAALQGPSSKPPSSSTTHNSSYDPVPSAAYKQSRPPAYDPSQPPVYDPIRPAAYTLPSATAPQVSGYPDGSPPPWAASSSYAASSQPPAPAVPSNLSYPHPGQAAGAAHLPVTAAWSSASDPDPSSLGCYAALLADRAAGTNAGRIAASSMQPSRAMAANARSPRGVNAGTGPANARNVAPASPVSDPSRGLSLHTEILSPPYGVLQSAEMQRLRNATAALYGEMPFGTEETLKDMLAKSKHLEDGLMMLCTEKGQLEAEYAKMPVREKTQKERSRKAIVEQRLELLNKEISNLRLHLKKLHGK